MRDIPQDCTTKLSHSVQHAGGMTVRDGTALGQTAVDDASSTSGDLDLNELVGRHPTWRATLRALCRAGTEKRRKHRFYARTVASSHKHRNIHAV